MISVITLAWNHCSDVTKPFIEEFFSKTDFRGTPIELIVVDNGSTDYTSEYLYKASREHSRLRVVTLKKNMGFAGGNNAGFHAARGEHILFMNNDIKITNRNWLFDLYFAYQENPNKLIGPQYITWNDATKFRNKIVPYLGGWCIYSSREVFEKIMEGKKMIWDENFGLAYFEDVELCERARLMGIASLGVEIGIEHLVSRSSFDQLNIQEHTAKAHQHYTNKLTCLHLEAEKKKRIVFFGRCPYPYIDDDYEGKGVGGSEASLILLAREFAKLGWQVEVYNNTNVSGKFNGVEYYHVTEFRPTDYCDVFVLFREPERTLPMVNAMVKIFWSCDQYTVGNWKKEIFPYVDRVIAISEYHSQYINMVYGPLGDKLKVIELGINSTDYEKSVEKIPGKLIFCSVPLRGLSYLVSLFPRIKERVKNATLYITSDYTLWGVKTGGTERFQEEFSSSPDVHYLGKIPRQELVSHQLTAEVMAYPCNYAECFCISAMECIASGAIPVTTSIAALKTTVGESGVLLSSSPGTANYDNEFVEAVVDLLTNRVSADKLRKKGRDRALLKYGWNSVIKTWISEIEKLEKKGDDTMLSCTRCKNEKKFANAYVLAKHNAKYHADGMEVPPVISSSKPEGQLLRFKRSVECILNSKRYEGKEFEVEANNVNGVLEIIQNAYGPDILET